MIYIVALLALVAGWFAGSVVASKKTAALRQQLNDNEKKWISENATADSARKVAEEALRLKTEENGKLLETAENLGDRLNEKNMWKVAMWCCSTIWFSWGYTPPVIIRR